MSTRELPLYQCYKRVRAAKIGRLEPLEDGNVIIRPADESIEPFQVSDDYCQRYSPTPGGYYVKYADGYESFSPCQAFEEGYTWLADDFAPRTNSY